MQKAVPAIREMLLPVCPRQLFRTARALRFLWPTSRIPYLSTEYTSRAESFLSGTNANFLEAQYLDWVQKKGSVDPSWDQLYGSLTGSSLQIQDFQDEYTPRTVRGQPTSTKGKEGAADEEILKLNLSVVNLIRSFQARGHLLAKVDPLGLTMPAQFIWKNLPIDRKVLECKVVARELGEHLSEKHMDMEFALSERTFIGGTQTKLPLREIQFVCGFEDTKKLVT